MKTFYSLEDIEKLASQGLRELRIGDDVVLTDLAREAAAQSGIKLVTGGSVAAAPSGPASPPTAAPGSGAKPRGCNHGPLTAVASTPPARRTGSPAGGLVDDLVVAVKHLADKSAAG